MGLQEIHEHEALGGGHGRRLRCRLTSLSRSLQTNLRKILDTTGASSSRSSVKRRNPNPSPTWKIKFGFLPFGPSDRVRTHRILRPNLLRTLFLLIYSSFLCFLICFTYSLTLLSPLFPGVPEPSVVIYVVKNASRPVSGELSPVPDGKRFAFLLAAL